MKKVVIALAVSLIVSSAWAGDKVPTENELNMEVRALTAEMHLIQASYQAKAARLVEIQAALKKNEAEKKTAKKP